jgi:hypothetical protein
MKSALWYVAAVVGVAGTLISCTIEAGQAATSAVPQACRSAGPISVSQLGHGVSLSTCPIRGRLLVLRLANGQAGPGLYVPRSGLTITNDTLTTSGDYVLSAANTKGWLTVNWSAPQHSHLFALMSQACKESRYNLEGPTWETFGGIPTDAWYYKRSSVPSGQTVVATEAKIRQASKNMTDGLNNCGYATGQFNIKANFKGNTSKSANIDANGNCASSFPDGQNTVSWTAFSKKIANTLAVTCYASSTFPNGTKNMTEADTAIGSNRSIVANLPKNCGTKYDLETVMTHEWRHVFGLAHETRGPAEVMYPTINPCEIRHRLANGDWNGMLNMYG